MQRSHFAAEQYFNDIASPYRANLLALPVHGRYRVASFFQKISRQFANSLFAVYRHPGKCRRSAFQICGFWRLAHIFEPRLLFFFALFKPSRRRILRSHAVEINDFRHFRVDKVSDGYLSVECIGVRPFLFLAVPSGFLQIAAYQIAAIVGHVRIGTKKGIVLESSEIGRELNERAVPDGSDEIWCSVEKYDRSTVFSAVPGVAKRLEHSLNGCRSGRLGQASAVRPGYLLFS